MPASLTDCPVHKNQQLTLHICTLNAQGQGLARVAGYVVFVPGALPGEEVRVQIIKCTARYAVAKLLEVVAAGAARATPACAVYPRCGGCTLQHMTYEAQLQFKQDLLRDAFARVGLQQTPQLPILGMEAPLHYRSKGAFPFVLHDNQPTLGLFAVHSHRVVTVESCAIQKSLVMQAALCVQQWARAQQISVYEETTHQGCLRHVVLRCNGAQSAIGVTVVTRTPHLPAAEALVTLLRAQIPALQGVFHNVNPEQTNVILGKQTRLLWGAETLQEEIGHCQFQVAPQAFFQVNLTQTQVLYDVVRRFAALQAHETLLDAYCGVGTIGQYLAQDCARVIGLESVPQAVENARHNAARNGIANAEYFCGQAEALLAQVAQTHAHVVVVDPPRRGCERSFLQAMARTSPERIVYVSCNPATLARDVQLLQTWGYRPQQVQPVDMFPHTDHVEAVCLLTPDKPTHQ